MCFSDFSSDLDRAERFALTRQRSWAACFTTFLVVLMVALGYLLAGRAQ